MNSIARPETLTEAVANHIRNAIISGVYAPGTALPEVRLATELGTSRGTVREALRALADEGLVDVFPHRGSFVSTITAKKAADIYDLRFVLEPMAVQRAIESGALATDSVRASIEARLSELRQATEAGDVVGMISVERELHRQLWWPCDNEILREFLSVLMTQTRRMLVHTRPFERDLLHEFEEHRRLVDTVMSGDVAAAIEAIRSHLQQSRSAVLARMNSPEKS